MEPLASLSADAPQESTEHLPIDSKYHLIVTTSRRVYTWSSRGTTELFSSNSNGIVTARKMQTDDDLLAVADSQVVVLHDVEKGMQQTYRLRKKDQGQVRRLFYHPEQQRLFFTTTLQNAVQTFSIRTSELLDAAPAHPSPPTVFAVSPACDLLVSASAVPPTIYLSRIAYRQPPLLFVPNCSTAPVVAMAFHPTRENVFALGFHDGTVAAYNATVYPTDQKVEERYSFARIYGEISHVTNLHSPIDGFGDESRDTNNELCLQTISAIQFLADQPCSIITIGSDGKCHILSLERNGLRKPEILKQWTVKGPATSLAVLKTDSMAEHAQLDGPAQFHGSPMIVVGIGKDDGTVGLYSSSGQLLATRDFSTDGRILDLEWMERAKQEPGAQDPAEDPGGRALQPTTSISNRSKSAPELSITPKAAFRAPRASVGSKIMVTLHVKDRPSDEYLLSKLRAAQNVADVLENTFISEEQPLHPLQSPLGIRQQMSGDGKIDEKIANTQQLTGILPPRVSATTINSRQTSRHSSQATISSRGSRKSIHTPSIPIIPTRPTPRPGGKLALRRMQKTKFRHPTFKPRASVPREIVRAATTGHPHFNDINHDVSDRPELRRNKSSAISPLSDQADLEFSPTTPAHAQTSGPTASTFASRSQKAPVQYDRLARTSWDAETSTSATQSSISHTQPRRETITPTRSKLADEVLVRVGTVRRAQASMVEKKPVTYNYVSDSTSISSVLDWTPPDIIRPVQIATDAQKTPPVPTRKPPSPPRWWVLEEGSSTVKTNRSPASDVSSGSQLNWKIGQSRHRPSDIKLSPKTRMSMLPLKQVDESPRTTSASSTPSLPPAQVPAALTIPKLRKSETVINLKDSKKESTQASESDALSFVQGEAEEIVVVARRSDPGPSVQKALSVKKDDEAAPQSTPVSKSPSISIVIPAVKSVRGSNSPGARRPSVLKTVPEVSGPEMRRGSTVGSQSVYTIEDVIRVECGALAMRMDVAFAEQKSWLIGFLREQNWYAQRLEEENRQFREELARLRK